MDTLNTPKRLRPADLFTREELAHLTTRSDWRGAWAIASTWFVIGTALAVLARWPNALTFIAALIVIGGRQLCLGILQHDASHRTLFHTRWLNDTLADWLCARPIWLDLGRYRTHHHVHHTQTGTDADTDITLCDGFPVTRASLARKLLRDVLGLTGLKTIYGHMLMDAGLIRWTVASDVVRLPTQGLRVHQLVGRALRQMAPTLLTNALLWAVLALSGHAWLYGVWVLAYLSTLPLFMRIRSIAEHACLARTPDVWHNTRTTRAGWLARMTVAPLHVNHHLAHHLMASVPYHRLPQMHRLLQARVQLPPAPGYLDVLKLASSA
jgi:fatty acid desaturase